MLILLTYSIFLSILKNWSVAFWNILLYVFITDVLCFFFQDLCISIIFLVSSSSDIYFIRKMFLTISWPVGFFWRKTGTSSWILRMILISILLMYSLKVLEWLEIALFRSLVIGWLPPSSEARRLTFNNLETTLSLLIRVEFVLFFLVIDCEAIWSGESGMRLHAP